MKGRLKSKAISLFRKLRLSYIAKRGGNYYYIARSVIEPFKENLIEMYGDAKSEAISNKMLLTLIKTMKESGCSDINTFELYNGGECFFRDLWHEIDTATERIWIETYIYVHDYIGQTTLKKLTEAAKRGVQVIMIFDHYGSYFHSGVENFEELIESGGHVYQFNPGLLQSIFRKGRDPTIRNHRKTMICDYVGFVGGLNIENCYSLWQCDTDFENEKSSLSEEEYVKTFRDTGCRLEGHCVAYIETCFRESFEHVTELIPYQHVPTGFEEHEVLRRLNTEQDDVENLEKIVAAMSDTEDDVFADADHDLISQTPKVDTKLFVQVSPSHPKRGRRKLQRSLYSLLDSATDSINITTPYFIPPAKMAKKIIEAADRGVKVKILTSGICDVPFYRMTAQTIYGKFLEHENIEMYEFYERVLHAKALTIDGIYSSVGSYNFDLTSFFALLEIGVHVFDPEFSRVLLEHFQEDLKGAKEITYEEWEKRGVFTKLLGWFLYWVMRKVIRK